MPWFAGRSDPARSTDTGMLADGQLTSPSFRPAGGESPVGRGEHRAHRDHRVEGRLPGPGAEQVIDDVAVGEAGGHADICIVHDRGGPARVVRQQDCAGRREALVAVGPGAARLL
jgi:hypothetical protein